MSASASSPAAKDSTSSTATPDTGSPTEPDPPTTIERYPALDGYRGLAVLAVVGFHAGLVDGGWLGVDLFFVLSGFLITRLIVLEHRATGRLDLGGFWIRRARRLIPALVVFFPVVAAVIALTPRTRPLPTTIAGEMVASIAYVANWFTLVATGGYWDEFSVRSPLRHMWSLSIEEQFYLVFPVVAALALALRVRHGLAGVLAIVALGSWSWSLFLLGSGAPFERVYLGTDTRIAAVALGGLIGYASISRRFMAIVRSSARLLAVPALVVVIAAMILVDGDVVWSPHRWLIVIVFEWAVIVLLLAAIERPSPISRIASMRLLVGFGAISYGLYLWHIPVSFVIDQLTWQPSPVLTAVVTLGVGSAIAVASYRLIEQPIRHRGLVAVGGSRTRALALGGLGLVALGGAVAVTYRSTESIRDPEVIVTYLADPTPSPSTSAPTPSNTATAAAADPDPISIPANTAEPITAEPLSVVAPATTVSLPLTPPTDGRPSVLFLGDSMVTALAPSLIADQAALGIRAGVSGHIGCVIGGYDPAVPNAFMSPQRIASCNAWRDSLDDLAAGFDPDVVVIMRNAVRDPAPLVGESVCDGDYTRWLTEQAAAEIELIRSGTDAAIVVTTYAYSRLGGVIDADRDRGTECVNRALRRATTRAGAAIVDLAEWICPRRDGCRSTVEGATLRRDGLHLEGRGASIALDWLIDEIFGELPGRPPQD